MRAAWLVLLATGCNQVLGVTDPHLRDGGIGPGDDAPGTDAPGTGDDASVGGCAGDGFGYAISNVASCDIPAATTSLALDTATIDTTAGTVAIGLTVQPLPATALVAQAGGGPQVRVVSVTGFRVASGATLRNPRT